MWRPIRNKIHYHSTICFLAYVPDYPIPSFIFRSCRNEADFPVCCRRYDGMVPTGSSGKVAVIFLFGFELVTIAQIARINETVTRGKRVITWVLTFANDVESLVVFSFSFGCSDCHREHYLRPKRAIVAIWFLTVVRIHSDRTKGPNVVCGRSTREITIIETPLTFHHDIEACLFELDKIIVLCNNPSIPSSA